MSHSFTNASVVVGNTATTVYTTPAATNTIVFNCLISNVANDAIYKITVEVFDTSGTVTRTLGKDIPIPIGSTLDFGKISLDTGDIVKVTGDVNAKLEAFLNILEMT